MGHRYLKPLIVSSLLLLWTATSVAAQEDDSPAKKAPRTARSSTPRKPKPKVDPNLKQVEMNGASLEELKTLPGINEDLAARIISGRPYLSKSNLVTHKILPMGIYQALKRQIFVIPPPLKPKQKS